MNQPLISVVIVTYNAGTTLEDTLNSIFEQTYPNIELVIIDGGSKDGTLKIIESHSSKIAYFISEKDNGVYDAMNKGITAAKGEWILFLGADDLLYTPHILADIFSNTDHEQVDLLYGDVEFKSNRKKFGGEKEYRTLIERNLCHQSIFYKRSLFKKLGNYNTRYAIAADHEMNLRVFHNASLVKQYIPVIVTLFNDDGMSNNTVDRYFHSDMLALFLQQDKMPFLSPELQQYHFYYGLMQLLNNKWTPALRHIPASWIRGKRKLFYFLFTGKFILKIITRSKITIK
jgi:glycosyltransferase involved in cell wall biosynthesis